MRLDAAINGNLNELLKKEFSTAEIAVTKGIRDTTNNIRGDLKQQVLSSGLGQGVANAWRAKFYPSGKSIRAAGYIYSKAPNIISAFNDGVTIKSAKGLFLAIPTPAAPKRGTDGKRINPSNFPESSFGKLRFVYRPGKVSLLVVDDLRSKGGKRGGFAKASASSLRTGRGLTSAVMFLLVPQVSLKKRFDIDSVTKKWEASLPDSILANWPDEETG